MNSDSKSERIAELAVRYLDRNLSDNETRELDQLIREDDDCCACFERVLSQAAEIAQVSIATEERGVASLPKQGENRQTTDTRLSSPFFWIPTAVAAAVTVIAILFAVPERADNAVASITFEGGEGRLGDEGGTGLVRLVPADQSHPLTSGSWFRLGRMDGSAELVFDDGTRVLFYQKAEAVLRQQDGQKILELKEGQITADVTPQELGHPFRIETPSSRLEVLGTELEVAASSESTDLVVTHGLVAMIRDTDGSRIEVGSGQRASVRKSDARLLEASDLAKLPDEWSCDFSEPPGQTWGGGKWQADGTMLAYPRFDLGYSHFTVTSNNAWSDGLHSHFQMHSDSYLELRFKMERPQWFIIRIGLRATPDSVRRFGGNAFYQDHSWHRGLESGEWRTLRIPLSEIHHFSRTESNDVDLNGLGAYLLSVGTQRRDAGLVIDGIRVGRESKK